MTTKRSLLFFLGLGLLLSAGWFPLCVRGSEDRSTGRRTPVAIIATLPPGPTSVPSPPNPYPGPASTSTPSPSPTPVSINTPNPEPSPGSVVINEVFYDAASGWSEPEEEWFELYNNTGQDVVLSYWSVEDNVVRFVFPEGVIIPARGYLVLAYDAESFWSRWGFVPLAYGQAAGNLRLSNTGDRLILRAPEGSLIDQLSYGDDSSALDPPCPDVPAGHSLEREPTGFDSDRASDFVEQEFPSPGSEPPFVSTPTPTATSSPVPSPTVTVAPLLISEVCYDGTTPDTEGDEFMELYNPLSEAVSLAGYKIGDEEAQGGGEGMYHLPISSSIGPGEVILVAKNAAQFHSRFGSWPDFEMKASGKGYEDTPAAPNLEPYHEWGSGSWALSNRGDEVLLLGPGDVLVDAVVFGSGDGEVVEVSGTLSAPAPRSLQRVLGADSDDMPADFAIARPSPGQLIRPPSPPEALPPSAELGGGLRAYWGCLHAHSTYSDGSGPPRYAYAVGRANGLHFLALTDHSHMYDAEQWADLEAQALAATEDGAFVALCGFEWTSQEGHINVFNAATSVSRDDPLYDTLSEFYHWLSGQQGATAQFNHPFPGDFADLAYDETVEGQISLLEVGNGGGAGYRRFEAAYARALGAGWRVGPTNNGDTETTDWGADTPHRTGVVAPELSRSALLDALRARRTFATEDPDLALALRSGGMWMGETLPSSGECQVTVIYRDADGEDAQVTLYERTLLVESRVLSPGDEWTVTVDGAPGHFYWARAEQGDGDLAYTSPLWVVGQARPEMVFLNELCPAPFHVDWDGDGTPDTDDEWVELYNGEGHPVGLGGWQLDDVAEGGSSPWIFPLRQVIPAHGYLVLFKRDTGLALNDGGDSVRLLRPDGSVADEMEYAHGPGYDRTWSRTEDGEGEWTAEYEPTMGEANEYHREKPSAEGGEIAPALPQKVTLAQARMLPVGMPVVVSGQVTSPPGTFRGGVIYIQDASVGMKVYLADGGYPSLAEGDWVQVEGELSDYHGEREIKVASGGKVQRLGTGVPLKPRYIPSGGVGESVEGLLIEVAGRVVGWGHEAIYLDDGSGEISIYFGRSELVEKPWVERGELYLVVGLASQYVPSRPYEGGYRMLPRYEGDVIAAPLELPITGCYLPPGMR